MRRAIPSVVVLGLLFGSAYVWSQQTPQWQQVGVLASDLSRGETLLRVKWIGPATVGRAILLEARDNSLREVRVVGDLHEAHVVLKQRVRHAFKAGSRIYQ